LFNQTEPATLLITTATAQAVSTVVPASLPPVSTQTNANGNDGLLKVASDREVILCITCVMVQYRAHNGDCRRCLHLLKPKVAFLFPPPVLRELQGDDRQPFEKWPNREMVENIGQRIRQLRECHRMTQTQLRAHSWVSQSRLFRIESGQMTPSIGTLGKISEALGICLNRFFLTVTNREVLPEDSFIQGLRPFLR
jgi:DNA-binding XRE family transcriptional regulator